ncbi:hypothetical protein PRK78_004237 [Emydomyces testavorans]|uniref:Uncharacterized protein n=1 Tax=Emydomyces testavorans TaxID=2070801 RepID=A0AAF0ILF2_9EURO|nr:hypothetical protein PRK78_004237 [Emydomyces testavorans]
MPIPTRSQPLHDSHSTQRKNQDSQDNVTSTTRQPPASRHSRTTSVSTTSTRSSHAHTGSEGNVSAGSGFNSVLSRRSLLPQRNLSGVPSNRKLERTVTAPLKVHAPETQPRKPRDVGLSSHSRRDSLSLAVKGNNPGLVEESGLSDCKQQQEQKSTERLNSGQAKPVQAPATRLDRSASLRQPVTSRLASAATSHTRHRSQVVGSGIGQTTAVHRQDRNVTEAQGDISKLRKPQFNTYQQHYSPKKPAPKVTPQTLSMNTGDNNASTTLPPHILPLQTELLQLHLLHSQALHAKRKWETNTDGQCRRLHNSVVTTYRSVLSTEQSIQRNRNAAAIEQFAAEIKTCNSRYDFLTQVQMLSKVIQEVSDLTDSQEGRYNNAVREFEKWSAHVTEVKQSRSQPETGDSIAAGYDSEFIESLSDEWRNDVAALLAKLELCSRELDCLEVGATSSDNEDASDYYASALVRAVKGHKLLIQSMIEELDVIAKIEAEVVKMERSWVKTNVEAVCRNRAPSDDVELRIPVWKRI